MSQIASKILKAYSNINGLAILIVSIYLVIAFFIVKDYGISPDAPPTFTVGEKYLHFYRTGHLDFQDDIPKIENHPFFYDQQIKQFLKQFYYVIYPFSGILSGVTCYIFYQKLHWLDLISAHNIFIPILTAVFLYILFLFVKKHWGNSAGLISLLALITYPRFFGHSFYNFKDVPETIFFSTTIMLFAEWVLSRRIKYIYLASICFGLALATKMDAILIPVILIIWQAPIFYKYMVTDSTVRIRTLLHIIIGFTITCILFASCYPPLLPGRPDKLEFLLNIYKNARFLGGAPNISWNLYAPVQILYLTPVIIYILFIFGLAWAFIKFRSGRLYILLIIWVLFPILRHCLPRTNHYDGLRHFLVFIVPFAIIVSVGVTQLSNICSRFIKIKKGLLTTFICMLFLIPNLYALISLHPYQTTYFNSLIGGLKGAQEKEFPFSCDYWFNSYRNAGKWLDKNAQSGSNCYAYCFNEQLKYYISRLDLKHLSLSCKDNLLSIPPNTYIVMVPRKWWIYMSYFNIDKTLSVLHKLEIVYQIKRQGGEILTIYYNPLFSIKIPPFAFHTEPN